MAQVSVDIEELESLAGALAEFADVTADSLARIDAKLKAIGTDSWNDEKFHEIERELAESYRTLVHALGVLENEQRPHLLALAGHARAWLGKPL